MCKLIFWISLFLLLYTWLMYPILLFILSKFKRKQNVLTKDNHYLPQASIIIAAYNEEKVIARRIENLLEQDYPKDKIEIIIASDGSTDRTVEIIRKYENKGVKVLNFKENRGRATVQNEAVKEAKEEIIIFTDADTEFDRFFLKNIVKYFSDKIGCVVGNLTYRSEKSSVSQAEGFYFKFEKKIRKFESDLEILATATGACMGIRKNLWKELSSIDDCDFTTPLDVILQGYKVVYAPDAIAYDLPPSSIKGELKVRIRQTAKNLIGTLKRWGWKGWIKHPFVSWGLLSHKLLRWFTPFFLLGAFLSNLFLLTSGIIYKFTFTGQMIFYGLGIIGFIGEILKRKIPIASTIFTFIVANIGMGIGVIKGLLGKAPTAYTTPD